MKASVLKVAINAIFLTLISIGCGTGTNLNKLLYVDKEDEKRLDHLLSDAQLAYDNGEYQEALNLLEKAEKQTSNSERVIQLKAFSQLAVGGFDPLSLIGKIVTQTEKKSSSSNDTGDILSSLSSILEISTEDLEKLGTKNEQSDNDILKGLTIFLPKNPGSHLTSGSPRYEVKALSQLNKAIATICPLINPELLKTDGTISMDRYKCDSFQGSSAFSAQAYVLFSLAHLIETLAFNIVLLYSSDSGDSSESNAQANSNIFKRIKKVEETGKQDLSLSSLTAYTEAITEVVGNVGSIFDTQEGTMLYETMANLRKTVSAFTYIEGIPSSFTKQVEKALTKIEEAAQQAGSTVNNISGETGILAQKLGDKIVTKLNSQVDTFFTKVDDLKSEQGGELTECQNFQISTMCTTMNTLVGLGGETLSSGCNDFENQPDPGNCETPSTGLTKK